MNRKSTSGGLKILVGGHFLADTITRLNGCASLLARNAAGSPELTTICYLLEAVADDLYNEVSASLDAEEEARKRNHQRTTGVTS